MALFCYHERMKERRIPLATSKNSTSVWYDSASSHVTTHIRDTPDLVHLAAEIVRQSDIIGPYLQFHVDFGRTVGTSDLVETAPDDKIIYAKRKNRDCYTVFNKSKEAQPSSLVTVALEMKADGTCELVSAWIGSSDSPSFPGTERETPDSKTYWSTHGLAWGNQEIQAGSETKICPW